MLVKSNNLRKKSGFNGSTSVTFRQLLFLLSEGTVVAR